MRRVEITPRHDWRRTAEQHGFAFHSPKGEVYWDESACYAFTLRQVEDHLEAAAAELEQMCLSVAARATRDETVLQRLAIPRAHWDLVTASWKAGEKNLYGRMDFAYDGDGPPKLYEYNADTPTSLYESAVFQWIWLEEARAGGIVPGTADQFNSLHERLVDALGRMQLDPTLHLAAVRNSVEDMGTVSYLADCAKQAGIEARVLAIEDIGISGKAQFTDGDDRPITALFKLYPWEWLLREEFAQYIATSGCRFIEPAWKSILSNKGLLPLLWEMYPGHPNLLPAFFAGDARAAEVGPRYVRKPLYSREGANVEICEAGRTVAGDRRGPYGAEGSIVQAFRPLPDWSGHRAVCGVWLVASEPAGLGIREERNQITTDAARFVPHVIDG